MYLTRVRVATEGLGHRALMALMQGNAYGNHQLLWRLFPGEQQRPFLFRQELETDAGLAIDQPRGLPLFYVLSRVEPMDVGGLATCQTKPFHPKLYSGQKLAFRMRANPVVARKEPGHKNSRRHDVLMDAKRAAKAEGIEDAAVIQERMDRAAADWLGDSTRAECAGYRLLAVPQVSGYQQHAYRRKGREIRFSSVDYEGVLEVRDPERFRSTLESGIGRSRAFGCGMWMIKPA